ncbi:peptide-methionine (S)-S-oxide reductase MsrA [Castellaniella sp.]|uniref:peptide-methionine (S)-S-oxide reductase MsrA n=1 Tax=Castellaniella sp. TaxID=1955812 RepID=UPI003561DE65
MEQIILGGGCFWCLEPVFQALAGVTEVVPGYCGGSLPEPTYEQVCRGDTGHVEVIRVTYDPDQIPCRALLEVFFGSHDPTTPDRQGNDVGPQYASVIFALSPEQLALAQALRSEVAAMFEAPLCTRIEMAGPFWPAEGVHHAYYANNPEQGYCRYVIAPKLAKFRQRYAQWLKQGAGR